MKFTEEVSKSLNELLEKNYDAEKGYKDAAERVENSTMKDFLEQQAQNRYDFGHELKDEIRNFGEEPNKGGSVKGTIHRSWMDLKAAVSSDSNERVMEEVQRGEQAAIDEYDDILKKDLPPTTTSILNRQRNKIAKAQQSAKNFEIIS